ncbi:MAG: hypothetical protein ACOCQ1_04045 [Halanaerobiaceae bacterium]
MERKEFIKKVDLLTDRELRQLFNFVFEVLEEEGKLELLEEEIDNIKNQRNL